MIAETRSRATVRRRAAQRFTRLAPMVAALVLASTACAARGGPAAAAQSSKVTELRSVSQLQDRFNEDSDRVRLILLVSPT